MATASKKKNVTDSYLELVKEFPLVSIHSARQLNAAQKRLDKLLAIELDAGGERYLDALSDLVAVYEDEHEAIPAASDAVLLAALIDARGESQSDVALGLGLSRSTISEILKGKRRLTREQIASVAEYFHVSARLFFAEESSRKARRPARSNA